MAPTITFLSPAQYDALRRVGYPEAKIRAYVAGTLPIQEVARMRSIIRGPEQSSGPNGSIWDDPGTADAIAGGLASDPMGRIPLGSETNYPNFTGSPFPSKPPTTPTLPKLPPNASDTIPKGRGPAQRNPSVPAPAPTGSSSPTTPPFEVPPFSYPDYVPPPAFPDIPDINVPVITPHDFTPQAQEIANSVFAPVLDSLDKSKVNIGQQGERSRQVLSGLYDNMVNDIAQTAAQSAKQYEAQKTDQTQRGQALQSGIAEGYTNQNNQLGQTAGALGLGAATPDATAASSADSSWQQGQAALNTQAMNDYWSKQGQGEQDLSVNRQNVARTTGAVAQEDNLNAVAQMLAGVDQQIAGTQTDKAKTAVQIAQNLSGQDLSAQGTNAGLNMQGQQAQIDALEKAWEAANQASSGQNSYNIGKAGAQNNYNQSLVDAWFKQQTLDQGTAELEQRKKEAEAQAAADAAKAAGQSPGGLIDLGNYSGLDKEYASFVNSKGVPGATAWNATLAAFANPQGEGVKNKDFAQFTQEAINAVQASDPSIPRDVVIAAASKIWTAMAKG